MTKYDDICEAYWQGLPRRLALHEAIEGLPRRILDALRAELGVPEGPSRIFSNSHDGDVPFIYLARKSYSDDAKPTWGPCPDGEAIFRDEYDNLSFGIGLIIERGLKSGSIHFTVTLAEIGAEEISIEVVNATGQIAVKTGDPASCAEAAKKLADWLLAVQSNPMADVGTRARIGFQPKPD